MESKQKTENRRDKIRNLSGKIVNLAELISTSMQEVPHDRGTAYRSLKPKSGEFIIHSNNSIMVSYKHTDGKFYEINICPKR